jgi:hypothetical protein
MWMRPHITNEVMPLDVTGPSGAITTYTVAIVTDGSAQPTTGFVAVETDGALVGPRISGLPAGRYQAYPRIGTRVLNPVPFLLT